MEIIDILIFVGYMVAVLSVGVYFMRQNTSSDDYYVGGRKMNSLHIGLSVVATDVGGGFSIGLGGLGFIMGISGSWMLFTGLVGAWLAAVFLIPKVKSNPAFAEFLTFPDIFQHYYGKQVALLAGIISAVGYAGFTSSQILAGAKLAHGTFPALGLESALIVMGLVAVIYTAMGGIKAVIYTDTVQWAILMFGLIFIGIPVAYNAVGGWEGMQQVVRPEMLDLTHVRWNRIVDWSVTIIPIWFVGMTLYQRIYACRDEATARRAWFFAGLLEYPLMAFMGVALGLLARVAADQGILPGISDPEQVDPETGLPILLRTLLPAGLKGILLAAYFSAILSTADSCMMASSGNIVSDIIGRFRKKRLDPNTQLRLSQWATLIIGSLALLLAWRMTNVLDLMLYSYAFMVSGLLVPILGALFWKKSHPKAALAAMLLGGGLTLCLQLGQVQAQSTQSMEQLQEAAWVTAQHFDSLDYEQLKQLEKKDLLEHISSYLNNNRIISLDFLNWSFVLPLDLDANFYGLTFATIIFICLSLILPKKPA